MGMERWPQSKVAGASACGHRLALIPRSSGFKFMIAQRSHDTLANGKHETLDDFSRCQTAQCRSDRIGPPRYTVSARSVPTHTAGSRKKAGKSPLLSRTEWGQSRARRRRSHQRESALPPGCRWEHHPQSHKMAHCHFMLRLMVVPPNSHLLRQVALAWIRQESRPTCSDTRLGKHSQSAPQAGISQFALWLTTRIPPVASSSHGPAMPMHAEVSREA
jgi:hypothetical protein